MHTGHSLGESNSHGSQPLAKSRHAAALAAIEGTTAAIEGEAWP